MPLGIYIPLFSLYFSYPRRGTLRVCQWQPVLCHLSLAQMIIILSALTNWLKYMHNWNKCRFIQWCLRTFTSRLWGLIFFLLRFIGLSKFTSKMSFFVHKKDQESLGYDNEIPFEKIFRTFSPCLTCFFLGKIRFLWLHFMLNIYFGCIVLCV